MTAFPLEDPARVDALLGERTFAAQVHLLDPANDLHAVRIGQVALASQDPEKMTQALERLEHVRQPPARGVRMMLLAQLGDYAGAAREGGTPNGSSSLELEDTCHAHAALAVVAAQTGQYEEAVMYGAVAIAFAQSLQLHNRVSIMQIEHERLMSLRGMPRPEELQRLLMMPMSERRRGWGRRTWAEALMALGDYVSALRVLGHSSIDSPQDRGLRDFLHALLRYPAVPEQAEAAREPYGVLAAASRSVQQINWDEIRAIQGQPEKNYAIFMEAFVLLGRPETARQLPRVLGVHRPERADQGLMHDLLWLDWLSRGHHHTQASITMARLSQAHLKLRKTQDVISVLKRRTPEIVALLGFTPMAAALDIHLVDFPLLTGESVLWQGERYRLPGRSGRLKVLEGINQETGTLTREEKRRYLARLEEIGVHEVVNLGGVIRRARELQLLFRQLQEPEWEQVWTVAQARATALLTAATARVLPLHH